MSHVVHLTNGDCAAEVLAHAGLPGKVIVWADVLHDGPLVEDGDPVAWRRRRAAFLAAAGHSAEPDVLATLERWDRDVEQAQGAEEVVLWFEPDLYDQLLLIKHLAAVARGTWQPRRLSLVCHDQHPALGDVSVLSLVSPAGARRLWDERAPVTPAQTDVAARAWAACCASTPEHLAGLTPRDCAALPFLGEALQRLSAEYPSVEDGLALTEHHALVALDALPLDGVHLFRAVQRIERRPFMGDASFYWRIRRLATAPVPLVYAPTSGPPDTCAHETVSLTDAGRRVARGEVDALRLCPSDRWIGGVHLTGGSSKWRWSRARRALTPGH